MEKKYLELVELLHKYNYYYYEKNESLVSDVEYDKLLKELEELEENYPELKISNSPSEKVGSHFKTSKFNKVTHKKSMLSLSNSYNISEVENFIVSMKMENLSKLLLGETVSLVKMLLKIYLKSKVFLTI